MTESALFQAMSGKQSWLFTVTLPLIYIVLLFLGLSRDDIVEEQISEIWIPKSGSFYKDKQYAKDVGVNLNPISTFLAMALSRDGGNIFTSTRLEEVRTRMEETESLIVEYKGEKYTWDDICASNSAGLGGTYKFPCVRLTPMDLFQESRWFLDSTDRLTWYDNAIRKELVKTRVPRFGVMSQVCTSTGALSTGAYCDKTMQLRQNETYAVEQGYPKSYANPLSLFLDISDMEFSNRCKICMEGAWDESMKKLTEAVIGLFFVLDIELQKLIKNGTDSNTVELAKKVAAIRVDLDRTQVEEYYTHQTIRALYSQIGAEFYKASYEEFSPQLTPLCNSNIVCPPEVLTVQEAQQHLINFADNEFSSITTAGSPFPFWSNGNGTGIFMGGTSPVSGSGLNLAGTPLSAAKYLDLENYGTAKWSLFNSSSGVLDPTHQLLVNDPVFKWFTAGQTPFTGHCGNGNLTGTGISYIDKVLGPILNERVTQRWCNEFSTPYLVDSTETVQHFAKMWYARLIDSAQFLGTTQGESDPYSWTSGSGCGYTLKGMRPSYTGVNESDILRSASMEIYYLDEGASAGPIAPSVLLGGTNPKIGEYNSENPLTSVEVIQTLYIASVPENIVKRVSNCNRPGGAINISEDDARTILTTWKERFEEIWTANWDDENSGDVMFSGYFDSIGQAKGTNERLLEDITLSGGRLTLISIVMIVLVSIIFLFSFDTVKSRIGITLVGITLVILSFFSSVGLGILLGIKVNINIAWTLPFIMLGLGVDDMYIILLSLKKQGGNTKKDFLAGMDEVIVPVTMTSTVNACMFGVMQLVDIPAVFKTAQVALISVIFLYLTIMFCYPAYCYLDMRRQSAGRLDLLCCIKTEASLDHSEQKSSEWQKTTMYSFMFSKTYKPLLLNKSRRIFLFSRSIIWMMTLTLVAVGIYGIGERNVGLGLEDFFPSDNQAYIWATVRTRELASWPIKINWGKIKYHESATQMKMLKQFEDINSLPLVASVGTDSLWMANLLIWSTKLCDANVAREDPDIYECGSDQIFPKDNSTCSGSWTANVEGLKLKQFKDGTEETCASTAEGICRPASQMHPEDMRDLNIDPLSQESYCPVFDWSEEKLQFCVGKWRLYVGGVTGELLVEDDATEYSGGCGSDFYRDETVISPIQFSASSTIYSIDLLTHDDTIDLIKETRNFCDDHDVIHCWMSGPPFNFWEQYLTSEIILLKTSSTSVAVGFVVAAFFLILQMKREGEHPTTKIVMGSLAGAFLIAVTTVLCLIPVIGFSVIADVNFTAFSNLSFVLSVGFAVEYSVHIVHGFLSAPSNIEGAKARVEYAMSFLCIPLTLSFISSTVGICCLAFTEFKFNEVYFFRPLIIVMMVTYFNGCWFLPSLLTALQYDCLNLGKSSESDGKILAFEDDKDGYEREKESFEKK